MNALETNQTVEMDCVLKVCSVQCLKKGDKDHYLLWMSFHIQLASLEMALQFFLNYTDASISKIFVTIQKRWSWGFQITPNLLNLMDLESNYDTFKKIKVSENHVVKHYITYEDSPPRSRIWLDKLSLFGCESSPINRNVRSWVS